MNKALLFLVLCALAGTAKAAVDYQVRISEFMASNKSTILDSEGKSSDWIEIHNAGSEAVTLEDWSLSDERKNPRKWVFPAVEIEAGAHLLVFASGKNRRDPGEELHCNFKLSSAGEYLALYSPEGVAYSCFDTYPAQEADVSYGYIDSCLFSLNKPLPDIPMNNRLPYVCFLQFAVIPEDITIRPLC